MKRYFNIINKFADITPQDNDISFLMEIEEKFDVTFPDSFKLFHKYYGKNEQIMNGYAKFLSMEDLIINENKDIIFANAFKLNTSIQLVKESDSGDGYEYIKYVNKFPTIIEIDLTKRIRQSDGEWFIFDEFILFSVAYAAIFSMECKLVAKADDVKCNRFRKSSQVQKIYGSDYTCVLWFYFQEGFKQGILCGYDKYHGELIFGLRYPAQKINLISYLTNIYKNTK
ncbi:hypothetical protein AN639_07405 [Candidatus Epulonipiscium fishelsonii]|uniref:Uncharacterized protein n=1 Tax=Candidatus Epulonipiscium fishelsonii TaxID=77094 RepID=A0ACC8X9Y8_9FIRM|nr:hypothetical protein AN639_07405 [Epulopiscium sp. SCG-B05WGA-EpuloA1]ONI39075.1 hypothetical protein AN396_09390 [Epulopiscium sp. SCG-B11WGA-EpuloA1]